LKHFIPFHIRESPVCLRVTVRPNKTVQCFMTVVAG